MCVCRVTPGRLSKSAALSRITSDVLTPGRLSKSAALTRITSDVLPITSLPSPSCLYHMVLLLLLSCLCPSSSSSSVASVPPPPPQLPPPPPHTVTCQYCYRISLTLSQGLTPAWLSRSPALHQLSSDGEHVPRHCRDQGHLP